jgi:hypothetical protein
MRHAKTDSDTVIGKAVKGICGPRLLGVLKGLGFRAREGQAQPGPTILDRHGPALGKHSSRLPPGIALGTRQYGRLGFDYLLRLASVGCAASLSFARVFTRILATALALAIVLTFARVFW